MNEIRLFMSGYQRHFWIAGHAAEALFRALDKELHVELFLVCSQRIKMPTPATTLRAGNRTGSRRNGSSESVGMK
jgi:hypothetical protein